MAVRPVIIYESKYWALHKMNIECDYKMDDDYRKLDSTKMITTNRRTSSTHRR